MKNHLYKAALVAALGLALSPVAKAADLYVGFNDLAGATGNDYVIDLGAYTAFTTSSTVSGSINPTLFNGVNGAFTSDANALNDVAVGAVAGGLNTSAQKYLYQTGNLAGTTPTGTELAQAETDSSAIPTGIYAASSGAPNYAWDYFVAQGPSTPDLSGNGVADETGNPESYLSGGIADLVLYESTEPSSGHNVTATQWTELGTLSINANPGADSITFTGVNAVPEPATCGLYAIGGLLMLALRRRISAKA
ncbi:MAG TPA: hypothetical protein VK811_02530 [Candidatus Acidoferrum sp.]|jgi:hypothetical protein|nr:hypothetical protein [Candidatus Acidoferrum sp.]